MAGPTYPLFPIAAFIGSVLALLPLPWHFEALNSATCYYMIWASLACMNQFVNSVVWANNALNPAPVWCDISTRITIGASVAIPAASLCINRRLYLIAETQAISVTRSDKRRAMLIDTLICVLFPAICMGFAYIVQGHRYNIYEEIGCYPSVYNALPAYFLVNWWPIVLGLISAVYCILSLRHFTRRRAQFKQFLSSKHSSLTFGRYFRLMALATTELLFTIPVSSYAIYLNATAQPIEPWVSWSYVHYKFSRIEQIPSLIWRTNRQLAIALQLGQWLNPLCAIIFFAYFGLAEEARRHYKAAFWSFVKVVGFSSPVSRRGAQQLSSKQEPTIEPPLEELPRYAPTSCQNVCSKSAFVQLVESPGPHDADVKYLLPASGDSFTSITIPDSPCS